MNSHCLIASSSDMDETPVIDHDTAGKFSTPCFIKAKVRESNWHLH